MLRSDPRLRMSTERDLLEEAQEPRYGEIVTHDKVASLQVQSVAKQILLIAERSDAQFLRAEDSLPRHPVSDEVGSGAATLCLIEFEVKGSTSKTGYLTHIYIHSP